MLLGLLVEREVMNAATAVLANASYKEKRELWYDVKLNDL